MASPGAREAVDDLLDSEARSVAEVRAAGSAVTVLPFRTSGEGGLRAAQANEARLFCLSVVRDREYREALMIAAKARVLPPAIERMIWHYAYGRPPDKVELQVSTLPQLAELPLDQLAARATDVARTILALSAEQAEADSDAEGQAQARTDEAQRRCVTLTDMATSVSQTEQRQLNRQTD